ncbi:repetitive organellar protein [Battus philenor]|uniref:repetitive organellar protein n=1 Tax=Battus philenor TaxID=42288 RepID=UPI0035D000B2
MGYIKVNISNTWVLPEEGFPVFYRYFRDKISWYEADAVCQFHHANLVTVDTTAQYDAVRAYLKELDISSAVWVGLIRSNPEGEFTWTDYRGLNGDGYWSSAPDPRIAPLCAAADPAADYRWQARACGGPTVASFICELPVPQWALGKEGCMVRALPALTILYLPESAAVQLTADCGLAGVKRLQCTGNMKRDELLRDLSCAEEVELLNTVNNISTNSTTTEIITLNENQDLSNINYTEENMTNEHEIENKHSTPTILSTLSYKENIGKSTISELQTTTFPVFNEMRKMVIEKNINDIQNNNLQSNDIPNLVNNDNFLTNYRIQKMEDEENMQHKKLHDELARLGNFETIFTQPTDHFVPPLVIAKAKQSNDMNVQSLEEKHAQYFGSHIVLKHTNERNVDENINRKSTISTEQPNGNVMFSGFTTEQVVTSKDDLKKINMKNILPKKYVHKDLDSQISTISKEKNKKVNKQYLEKNIVNQSNPSLDKVLLKPESLISGINKARDPKDSLNDSVIDLTVTLKESDGQKDLITKLGDVIDDKMDKKISMQNVSNEEHSSVELMEYFNDTQIKSQSTTPTLNSTDHTIFENEMYTNSVKNDSKIIDKFYPVSDLKTKMPVFKDDLDNTLTTSPNVNHELLIGVDVTSVDSTNESTKSEITSSTVGEVRFTVFNTTLPPPSTVTETINMEVTQSTYTNIETVSTVKLPLNTSDKILHSEPYSTSVSITNESFNATENVEETDNNSSDLETIDDFQSPLLSAANEPLQRPNRSRRPKQPLNRINKFNPFRILG